MHDVVTGFWTPNAKDINSGLRQDENLNCFGITTNIINGGLECGMGSETYGSQHRMDYYKQWMTEFGLPREGDNAACAGCGSMKSRFPDGGNGHTMSYFDQDWSGDPKCKLVSWQTGYSVYARDDYKRCICDKFGSGAADCPQAENNDPPTPIPDPVVPDDIIPKPDP